MTSRRIVLVLAVLALLPRPASPAQEPPGPEAPSTLEDLAKLARLRAREPLNAGRRELQQLLPDLSLSYLENREFVERAVQALARRGPDLAPLLLPYLDPENPQPKDLYRAQNVARILKEMGLGSLVRELIQLVRTGRPTGRAVAAELLGAAGRPEAAPALLASLGDPAPEVAAAAALALAELRVEEAREPLFKLMERNDRVLRDALLRAFDRIGRSSDLDRILPVYADATGEETQLLLLHLIEGLGKGNQAALNLLGNMASHEGLSLALRQRAVEVMGRIGSEADKDALTVLRNLLRATLTPEPLRRQAAYTLGDLGDSSGHKVVLAPADRFVTQNPKLPYAWVQRGDIHFRLGLYAKAAKDYGQAISLCKGSVRAEPSTWIDLFRSHARMGRYKDLLQAVRRSGLKEEFLKAEAVRHPELRKACQEDPAVARALLGE